MAELGQPPLALSLRTSPPWVGAALRAPLNLWDCFAHALAVAENDAILTLDRDLTRTNVRCLIPKTPAKH